MAIVRLRSPLRDLAGGATEIRVDGASVGEVLRALEREHTGIAGWILDEHGRIRRHVNIFVGGERAGEGSQVARDDIIHVLASISGGAA